MQNWEQRRTVQLTRRVSEETVRKKTRLRVGLVFHDNREAMSNLRSRRGTPILIMDVVSRRCVRVTGALRKSGSQLDFDGAQQDVGGIQHEPIQNSTSDIAGKIDTYELEFNARDQRLVRVSHKAEDGDVCGGCSAAIPSLSGLNLSDGGYHSSCFVTLFGPVSCWASQVWPPFCW